MSSPQSGWEVKLHLSALKAGRRFQCCLCGLLDRSLSSWGGWVGGVWAVSSGATKIATAAVQVQPSLLNMVWQPYTEKENDGERVVLVLVWSPAGVKWTVLHSPWTWKLTGVGPVCQLSSVCLQTPKHLHSSRDIFVTQKKQIETSSTKTQLKALKH